MELEKSKSAKKREAEALKNLGVSFIDWSMDRLQQLELPDHVLQAIIEAKSLKSHGAVRRQAQLIGKLMRSIDMDPIMETYHHLMAEDKSQTAGFHNVEHWRARLIQGGKEALTEFIDTYHPEDVQELRQLIKKAVEEQERPNPTGASRALFRHIRPYVL